MGSFNVACGISNISINEGSPVGFLLMSKTQPGQIVRGADHSKGYAFQVHPHAQYTPFLPMVFGTYDDYGNVADVEETRTSKIIEAIFKRPIETVIRCITENELYGSQNEFLKQYGIENHKLDSFGPIGKGLESVGFIENINDANEKTYTYKNYTVVFHASGLYSIIHPNKTVAAVSKNKFEDTVIPVNSALDVLRYFHEVTNLLPGFKEEHWSEVKLLSSLYGMYVHRDIWNGMSEYIDTEAQAWGTEIAERNKKERQMFFSKVCKTEVFSKVLGKTVVTNGFKLLYIMPACRQMMSTISLPLGFYPLLGAYSGSNEMDQVEKLYETLRSVNRIFQPSFVGTQDGEPKATRLLHKLANKAIASHGYDDEEDKDR